MPVTGNSFRDLNASWEEVTGVLGVDWTPDDDTLIYGKYNRGYKPGGLGCADVFGTLVATPYTDQETRRRPRARASSATGATGT